MTNKEFEEFFQKEFGDKIIDIDEEKVEIKNILGTEKEANKKNRKFN